MSVIHAPVENKLEIRQIAVPGAILLFLVVYLGRIAFLQLVASEDLKEEAERSARREVNTLAPRGQIFDRNGRPLAGISATWVVRAVPAVVKEHPESLGYASEILGADPAKLQRELDETPYKALPTDIYTNATLTQAMKIAEARSRLPEFDVEIRALRQVIEPKAYSHILGYVGKPSQSLIDSLKEKGITPAEYVGRDGLERFYERDLMGEPGKEVLAVDARSRPISRLEEREPVAGSRVFLSLDDRVQKAAQAALAGRKGAIAALDPRSGEVLAFYSAPSFDLRLWEGGISRTDYDTLLKDPGKPLTRRPSSGLYSPGSTFKIVTALAAARGGVLDLNHHEYCNGGRKVGDRLVACKNHGRGMSLNFASAFRLSCNTYFISLALRVGPEALHKAALDLGLGRPTGIDLPSEEEGTMPDGKRIRELGGSRRWYQGDTANFGIGQGTTLVTPLQMALVASAVGNNGRAFRPHFVRAVQGPEDKSPRFTKPVETVSAEAPDSFWRSLRSAMGTVVASGTARRAQIPGVVWGGKTGSTQHGRGRRTHSWFVGIAPLENPTIAIAVLAEEAGHGGDVAAPVAAQVVRAWLQADSKAARASSTD
jgi:penicillin-binding protein 2